MPKPVINEGKLTATMTKPELGKLRDACGVAAELAVILPGLGNPIITAIDAAINSLGYGVAPPVDEPFES